MGYVYKIINTVNNKAYIGVSIHEPEKKRIKAHLSGHGNRYLKNAVKKYGKDAFTYEILEANVFDEFLPDLEVAYIEKFNTVAPNGYNLTHGGEKNKKPSAETRRKQSEASRGRKHSEETLRKISEISKRNWENPEYLRKMSVALKGENHPFYGKTHSAHTRRKISKSLRGKMLSADHRRKIGEAHKGKKRPPRSAEWCRKQSEANRSPEYIPAYDFFLSLPSDMPLKEKRKLLYAKFPNINERTIRRWVQKWLAS